MIPLFKPNLGKEEADEVARVLTTGWIGNGPKTKEFEDKFLQFTHSNFGVALNSASAALHLAILSAGIKEGDEIITPSFTFVATNHPILMQKAKPVFCDVDYETLCADPKDIERKITKKTKAIIVVHYGGHPANLSEIIKLCKKHKITLIEDCAHASGAYFENKHVGSFGDLGCFSFAAIKNLTTGDGGMLVGKSKTKIERARTLAWSGISQSTWDRAKKGSLKWRYNVSEIGWKYQMNDISAAIGLVQLTKLKAGNLKRKAITEAYNKEFKKISWVTLPVVAKNVKSSHHNYVIKVPAKLRDKLSNYLGEKGISTSVHYVPSHHYKMYAKYKSNLAVTEKVWREILLLPIYPNLNEKDQGFIIDSVKKFK